MESESSNNANYSCQADQLPVIFGVTKWILVLLTIAVFLRKCCGCWQIVTPQGGVKHANSDDSIASGHRASHQGQSDILQLLRVRYQISDTRNVRTYKATRGSQNYFIKCFEEGRGAEVVTRFQREEAALLIINGYDADLFCPHFNTSGVVNFDSSLYNQLAIGKPCRCIVTDFIPGTLHSCLEKGISAASALRLVRSLFRAISFLHDTAKVAHHDIKPQNIGLANPESVRIFDFDLSVEEGKETADHGTISFLAPELVMAADGEAFGFEQLKCTDMYAAGLCVWTTLMSADPQLERGEVRDQRGEGTVVVPFQDELTVIWRIHVDRTSRRRYALMELKQIMQHSSSNESPLPPTSVKPWWAASKEASILRTIWQRCACPDPQCRPLASSIEPLIATHMYSSDECGAMAKDEKDGSMLSRWKMEEREFVDDDCGLCEVDGNASPWNSGNFPGEPGDILEFFRGTYLHYAVKVDREDVVHMTGDGPVRWHNIASSASENAVIKKESFCKVAKGAVKVQIWNKYDGRYKPYPAEKIVRRALSNLGRRGYHLLFLNCEHFSNWCRYGVSMSHQAEVLGTAMVAGTGAAVGSLLGPIGAALGVLGGVVVATGSTLWRHRKEYHRVRRLKRSVSTALMPSMLLSEHNVQSGQRNGVRSSSVERDEREGDQAQ